MRMLLVMIGVLVSCVGIAVGDEAKPRLWASVSVNQAVAYEEMTREMKFVFSLVNQSKHNITIAINEYRFFINNREFKAGDNIEFRAWATPHVLKLGESFQISSDSLGDFNSHLEQPGTYTVRWRGKNFEASPITIQVLPLRNEKWTPIVLVRAIRARLPAGWKVFYTPRGLYRCIEVVRLQPLEHYRMRMPNEGIGDKPEPNPVERFTLRFDVERYLSPEDYTARKASNSKTQKLMGELSRTMQDIDHKSDSFLPNTPEEKARVAHYESLRNALYDLPEFSYSDIGLTWGMPMTFRFGMSAGVEGYYRYVVDAKARAECREVTRRVLSLLSRYEPAPQTER